MIQKLPQPLQPPIMLKSMVSYEKLLEELRQRNLSDAIVGKINAELSTLQPLLGNWSAYSKEVRKSLQRMVKLLEKETGLVTKNHYRNQWMALGMAAFGIPMGMVFSIALGNTAFIGLGIPMGLSIGIAMGISKDHQAEREGKLIDMVLEY